MPLELVYDIVRFPSNWGEILGSLFKHSHANIKELFPAYPLSETMVRPYCRSRNTPLTRYQKKFNKHLSSGRSTVERTIGRMRVSYSGYDKVYIQFILIKHYEITQSQIWCRLQSVYLKLKQWQESDKSEGRAAYWTWWNLIFWALKVLFNYHDKINIICIKIKCKVHFPI